jgi:hypothetical protein
MRSVRQHEEGFCVGGHLLGGVKQPLAKGLTEWRVAGFEGVTGAGEAGNALRLRRLATTIDALKGEKKVAHWPES